MCKQINNQARLYLLYICFYTVALCVLNKSNFIARLGCARLCRIYQDRVNSMEAAVDDSDVSKAWKIQQSFAN